MTESQVGRPVSRVDGVAKVTGAARYAADAEVRGVTHAVLVMSTVARGRVTAVDTAGASAAPGVLGVFTHQNLARLALPSPAVAFLKRFLPVQDDLIRHAGQPVAIVVADTLERAQQASGLVGVSYRAEPPRVVLADDMGEAYIPPQTNDGANDYVRGDVAAGLAAAHAVAETTYTTPMQHHNALEPSVTVAAWDGDRLTVHESTQGISNTQNALMQAFGLARENVRVLSPYLGGGFGAKGPVWPHTVLTAAVARQVGRPVKLVLTRAQAYTSNGHRAETHQVLRVGAARDGRLTAIQHTVTQQVSRTEDALLNSSEPTRILYACPNVRSTQQAVRLDLPMGSFVRSPETATSHALESTLDELSYTLGLDPVELRVRNWSATNQESGERHGSSYLRECYERGAERFGWSRRDPRPGSMRDRDGLIGWGMATAAHTAGGRPGSSATVTIGVDGTARIRSGTQDLGTGTYTVMRQLGAEVLGLRLRGVRFDLGDSAFPAAFASAASATVPSVGAGVVRAATAARDRVIALAVADPDSPLHGAAPDQVSVGDGDLFLTERPSRRVGYRQVMRRHGRLIEVTSEAVFAPMGYSVGATFVEVHVDPVLGRVQVRRMVGVFDCGRVLNHRTARSQAIGGAIWAIGFTLSEHTLVDPNLGRIVTPNLSGYLVPVNADVPDIDVSFIDKPDPSSPALGARGFGETPMTGVTAAIGNAVYHATGHRIRDLPITQDKIIAALS
ncbi:xanthine dehydrogenase family protein molybdopterin-binding subunit [Nonomuraea glycinis]|uniref:Carbon-monoxide dehydrogenase large subunit n=1 Tax=Nonomuraea glycinis TaxID=2047744 RepID=A0A918AB30_9ACTN|nr:xanthine dehydrogenase family protein molybdopterin-binding subunit [Nonomuraea glycinis]MCA2180869.1 xanthine dehydrogenase family protein molybdopterin-binding subunit [Nonomuraea glycinis]GGP12913.1 carbon-monoxide dehydrogenase large subunit [Nonomuraea glycinis]